MSRSTDAGAEAQSVEFFAGSIRLRGVLNMPTVEEVCPLVILAHGFGGLKEWTIPEVAADLVDAGIGTLAFDYRNFGDSDGLPREEVDPLGQIEDWRTAITYATTLPRVDAARIGIWGTSYGGRNVLATAAVDRRIACVVAQVPAVTMADEFYLSVAGGEEAESDRMHAGDRRRRLQGEEPTYIPLPDDPNAEHASYWATWGDEERRNFKARLTLRSFERTIADDISPLMDKIAPTPLRMLLASGDTLCPFAKQLEAYVDAKQPKSLVVLPGGHYSVYTTWKAVAIASARDWFVEHLLPPQGAVS